MTPLRDCIPGFKIKTSHEIFYFKSFLSSDIYCNGRWNLSFSRKNGDDCSIG